MPPRKNARGKKKASQDADYPDPDYEGILVDMDSLPNPPKEWTLFGYTDQSFASTRDFSLELSRELVAHHLWGFQPKYGRKKKEAYLTSLRKLIYNQAEQHRPQTLSDFIDVKRDAGPRLLKPELNAPPLSRFYPTLPAGTDLTERRNLSANERPSSRPATPVNQPQATQPAEIQVARRRFPQPGHFSASGLQWQGNNVQQLPRDGSPHPVVMEAVERAVIGLAYDCLDRHPQATTDIPRQNLVARREDDLQRVEWRQFSVISRVLLRCYDGLDYVIEPDGLEYACHGRGPFSGPSKDANSSLGSSAIDCLILAGKYLEAGNTKVDRAIANFYQRLSSTRRHFLSLVDTDWAALTPEDSKQKRDALQNQIFGNRPAVATVQALWDELTTPLGQFNVASTFHPSPCPCLGVKAGKGGRESNLISVTYFGAGAITMEEFLTEYFLRSGSLDCEKCGRRSSTPYKRLTHCLPLRLAVEAVSSSAWIKGHTSQNIKIRYVDESGQGQLAVYRWLGGIYSNGATERDPGRHRHRLYWTEAGRGERRTNKIRMFDSTQNLGLIVGDIEGSHRDEPIPAAWCRGGVPLLFYERVLNPTIPDLVDAQKVVSGMLGMVKENYPILNNHPPWTSATRPIPQLQPQPQPQPQLQPQPRPTRTPFNPPAGPFSWQGAHASSGRIGFAAAPINPHPVTSLENVVGASGHPVESLAASFESPGPENVGGSTMGHDTTSENFFPRQCTDTATPGTDFTETRYPMEQGENDFDRYLRANGTHHDGVPNLEGPILSNPLDLIPMNMGGTQPLFDDNAFLLMDDFDLMQKIASLQGQSPVYFDPGVPTISVPSPPMQSSGIGQKRSNDDSEDPQPRKFARQF